MNRFLLESVVHDSVPYRRRATCHPHHPTTLSNSRISDSVEHYYFRDVSSGSAFSMITVNPCVASLVIILINTLYKLKT